MKQDSRTRRIILLDAHAIIHRAYHALPHFTTRTGVPTGALYGFGMMVLKIIDDFEPDHIIACYDLPGKTFRHESFDDYKKGRAETDDALKVQFNATRELCEALAIPIYDAPGFEADDMLGTIIQQLSDEPNIEIMIASGDMDTIQLVEGTRVKVYTLRRNIKETVIYDEDAVIERFGFQPKFMIDYKALRGDPSDNIPGVAGVGDKAATLAIKAFGPIEELYKHIDQGNEEVLLAAGLTKRMIALFKEGKEEAEFSKILATIRRDAPITFTIPEDSWKLHIDVDKASDVFRQYELKTLIRRLYEILGLSTDDMVVENKTIPSKEQEEAAIKLWMIDSDRTNADIHDILTYAQTRDFEAAYELIDQEIRKDEEVYRVFEEIEQPLMPVVHKMRDHGILIDQEFFKDLSETYHHELDLLEKDIHRFAGTEFNIKSPKQLSEVLFEKMELSTKGIKKSKSGGYSTNIDTLTKLKDEHPIIEKIIEFRELEKLLSSYIDTIPKMVGEDDRLHADFLQNGTVTGRFASRNPNMQNIPTRTDLGRKIRKGFIAKKGFQFVSFDYSQIELRCLAILSGDEALIRIFQENQDIHTAVAALIGGVPIDQVDREMRRKAKIVNFGILYGMGITTLSKEMNTDRGEAQKFYDGFFTQFPDATRYLAETKEHARTHGYTKTFFGRKRQFKNINSSLHFIRAMAERMALNAPIQGTSADIIKLAMVHIDTWLSGNNHNDEAHLVLQIHDEIIYEVRDAFVDTFIQQAEQVMKEVLKNSHLHYESPVPLVVHSSQGTHWGELK